MTVQTEDRLIIERLNRLEAKLKEGMKAWFSVGSENMLNVRQVET